MKYSLSLNRAMIAALPFIRPVEKPSHDDSTAIDRTLEWVLKAIEAAERGLAALIENKGSQQLSHASHTSGEDDSRRNLYSVIDQVVTHMYFVLDTKPNVRQGTGTKPTSDSRRHLYWRVKPTLKRILRFARVPVVGILAGPTAHRFMQLLNEVLNLDPAGVIKMAWEVVDASRPHGFNLDSLAIEEVVKITESILADHRLQARSEATLSQILEILEIFSETGWPQALRLIWRLDEVYR